MLEHHADARVGAGLGDVSDRLQGVADRLLVSDVLAADRDFAPVEASPDG